MDLSITPSALAVMRQVTAHPRLEPTSGLRIAMGAEPDLPMQVAIADGPDAEDSVVTHDGARLILGPGAEEQVEGRKLDAVNQSDGRVKFILKSA